MSFSIACGSSDLVEGRGKCVILNGKKIALFRVGEKIHAVDDTCTHDEASLSEGTILVENGACVVECPWHGAHFNLCTGTATLPAVRPVTIYPTREIAGSVEVDV